MAEPFVEHCYASMVEQVSDYAIILLDRTGIIETWNPAAVSMKGYFKSEAIGGSFSMLYTDEDKRRHRPEQNLRYAAEHGTFQEQAWRQRKDGTLFWAMVEIIAMRNESGELQRFCKLTRDISEMKLLQDNLMIEKERAEVTLGAIADGVISVNSAGQVEYLNHQAQRLTGWSWHEARGLRLEQVFAIVQQDDYSAEEVRLVQADLSATRPRMTQVLQVRSGARYVVEVRQSDIPSRAGVPGGTVIVFHDVIERQRMELALRDADRQKDDFLAMLAHELRNPLAPVVAAGQLLALGNLKAAVAQNVSQIIIRQIKQVTELVDDLLDVSRLSRGQVTLNTTSVDMKAVVGYAIEQIRPLIESRQHVLTLKLATGAACVAGDENRLVQVVANLLNNAAKYTPPEGMISVEVSVADSNVIVQVGDNGVGIEPAMQSTVFELFEQVHRTSERGSGGLGIGLSLVRSLTQMHGGRVTCHSAGHGLGSRFIVSIPELVPHKPAPKPRRHDRVAESLLVNTSVSVLVVDNEADATNKLLVSLATEGYKVTLASTAMGAMVALRSLTPDICIVHTELPDTNAYELASNIRKMASRSPVLIALTGVGVARHRNQDREHEFDHYVVEPADLKALFMCFRHARPYS